MELASFAQRAGPYLSDLRGRSHSLFGLIIQTKSLAPRACSLGYSSGVRSFIQKPHTRTFPRYNKDNQCPCFANDFHTSPVSNSIMPTTAYTLPGVATIQSLSMSLNQNCLGRIRASLTYTHWSWRSTLTCSKTEAIPLRVENLPPAADHRQLSPKLHDRIEAVIVQ